MFIDEDRAYPVGTFKLGQTVYRTVFKLYEFIIHDKCELCDSNGYVLIKGEKFRCPKCYGDGKSVTVYEMVLDDKELRVKGIYTFTSKNKAYEAYIDGTPYSYITIEKEIDGTNRFFANKEEAIEACNKYNTENNVYKRLEQYRSLYDETD